MQKLMICFRFFSVNLSGVEATRGKVFLTLMIGTVRVLTALRAFKIRKAIAKRVGVPVGGVCISLLASLDPTQL